MKALKIIGVVVVVVVIAFGGLIYYGWHNINNFLKAGIEAIGSEITETRVTLDDVDLQITKGRGELLGFVIGNPAGFNTDYAFSLDKIALQINPQLSNNQLVVIDEILIDGANLIYEEQNVTGSNLKTIADAVKRNTNGNSNNTANDDSGTTEAPNAPKIRVAKFQFSNAKVQLVSQGYGDRTIALPTVAMTDVGGENGASPQEVSSIMLNRVLTQARNAVEKEIEGKAKQEVRERAKDAISEKLSDENKEKLEGLKSLLNR